MHELFLTLGLLVFVAGCGSSETGFGGPQGGAGGASSSAAGVTSSSSASSGGGHAPVPDGWNLVFREGCVGTPLVRYTDPQKAACTPCSCGPITGPSCFANADDAAEILNYSANNCPMGTGIYFFGFTPQQEGKCLTTFNPGGPFLRAKETKISSGDKAQCAPAGGQVTPKPLFASMLSVCAEGTGAACIEHPGDVASCPAAWPKRELVFGQGATDGRSCSSCSCTAPPAAQLTSCTEAKISLYTSKDCSGSAIALTPQSCLAWNVSTASVRLDQGATIVGGCTAGGGVPSGAVQPTDPFTLCCE